MDINNVVQLRKITTNASGLILGAGTTLTEAIQLFKNTASTEGLEYLAGMSKHIERVANVPVRNVSLHKISIELQYFITVTIVLFNALYNV